MKEINIKAVEKALMKELKDLKSSKNIIMERLFFDYGIIKSTGELNGERYLKELKIIQPLINLFDKIKKSNKYAKVELNYRTYIDGSRDLYSVLFIEKPCKEFLRLAKKFEDVTGKTLLIDDIKNDYLFGKRGYYDVENTTFLCHSPKKCLTFLEKLKGCKSAKDIVIVEKRSKLYDADRYNGDGEDMESEWDGEYSYWVEITIETPTGRYKNGFMFLI